MLPGLSISIDDVGRIFLGRVKSNFLIQEFVPKVIYDKYGPNSIWQLDPDLILGIQFIRNTVKLPIMINNWHKGGMFQNRGKRRSGTTVGAKDSQHFMGRAVDFNIIDGTRVWPSKKVFDFIFKHESDIMSAGFTTIENHRHTKGWTHLDMRSTARFDSIFVVNP